jgi:hypothetical protein
MPAKHHKFAGTVTEDWRRSSSHIKTAPSPITGSLGLFSMGELTSEFLSHVFKWHVNIVLPPCQNLVRISFSEVKW